MDGHTGDLEQSGWNEDSLFLLLLDLRDAGFEIGLEEHLLALRAAEASRSADSNADPRRLRNYLGPVVCNSPEQQRAFFVHFESWWIHHCGGRESDVDIPPPPPPLAERETHEVAAKTRPWKYYLGAIAAFALVVASQYRVTDSASDLEVEPATIENRPAVEEQAEPEARSETTNVAAELTGQAVETPAREPPPPFRAGQEEAPMPETDRPPDPAERQVTITGRVVDLKGRGIEAAEARMIGERAADFDFDLSDTEGHFELRQLVSAEGSHYVMVEHGDSYPPQPFPVGVDRGGLRIVVNLAPRRTPWTSIPEAVIRTGFTFLPLIVGFFWWLRRRRSRQVVLERRATHERQSETAIGLPEPRTRLYRGARFDRIRGRLRRRYVTGRGVLDADATVERTLERQGFPTLVYRRRLELPLYLALVERSGGRDQQARRVHELLDRLAEGGVEIERYYFDRDPRRVRPYKVNGRARHLTELAAFYPRHRLLLFSDGACLSQPFTGRLASWTEQLSAWSERALLSPVPARHWTQRELAVAAAGFRVLPSTAAGVGAFIASIEDPEMEIDATGASLPPLPELIAEQPGRWLERHPAEDTEVAELCQELRVYLGHHGYGWLCALAVYPDLDWFLTLTLGLKLRRGSDQVLDEATLIALCRLPWLRHGAIPDWLRLHLIRDLSEDQEKMIRDLLRDLLDQRLETPGSRFRLTVARPTEPETAKTRRRWNRLLRNLLRSEPPGSRFEDHVFVSFLLGKAPSRLQILAPGNWRRFVYERGLPALGLRSTFFLPVLLTVALTATAGSRFVDRFADALAPPDLSHITEEVREVKAAGVWLRYIPPDTFLMGNPDEPRPGRDESLHEVTLSRGFWMAETEVTREQWSELMEVVPSDSGNCIGDCPVAGVSWFDAVAFANRLSDAEGLDRCYELLQCTGTPGAGNYVCENVELKNPECSGYRLPTEAEWEYAARAGESSRWPGGSRESGLEDFAWYNRNARFSTHPVATRLPNDWGLYDMHGNVWEWVEDTHRNYSGAPQVDPLVTTGTTQVIRGGAFDSGSDRLRSAARQGIDPETRLHNVGFRFVRRSRT